MREGGHGYVWKVLPTRVGMSRGFARWPLLGPGSPHTRGDVPKREERAPSRPAFSPHAWGCPGLALLVPLVLVVLPTRVGMSRASSLARRKKPCSPHTRGDVPGHALALSSVQPFSPHAWGCPASRSPPGNCCSVLPTRVGMSRNRPRNAGTWAGSPHTRGDVPPSVVVVAPHAVFSPHAWGCPGAGGKPPHRPWVLPTRVGMSRVFGNGASSGRSSPHTRGDVPKTRFGRHQMTSFSPHAWGCPNRRGAVRQDPGVLPTRVGMSR